jgi:hypothetical protein
MDTRTNKIAWQHRIPGEMNYGWVTTATNLAFAGQIDGNLVAFDAKTGDELWRFQVGWGIGAPPMTYAVDGVQYVAVAAGGNRGGVTTLDGDAVMAFRSTGRSINSCRHHPELLPAPSGNTQIGQSRWADRTRWHVDRGDRAHLRLPLRPAVQVPVGTTLIVQTRGGQPHRHGREATVGCREIRAGEAKSITLQQAEAVLVQPYVPHPWMIGKVTVTG